MELKEILARCDHTLLSQGATASDIKTICDEGIKFGCASVCIPACHVAGARRYAGGKINICTVIGFPNGYSTTATKVFEAADAVKNGADELDMVINHSMVRDKCWQSISDEVRQVRRACPDKVLKVIIETCLLDEGEKIMLCDIVSASEADFIKTSTGFSTGGATREDIRLMRLHCSPALKIKAAGGIATLEDAEELIGLGADRLGTSRIVRLALEHGAQG